MTSSFYTDQKEELIRDFRKKLDRVSFFIDAYFEDEAGDALRGEFLESFAALIPQIPYIGGKSNPLTGELIQSAWALAIYEVLQRRGKTTAEIGLFVYKVREALIATYPQLLLRLFGRYWFTGRFRNKRRKLAADTQEREYDDNFVITFVEGDGEAFDFGFDDTECAILKFFRKQGVAELVPYLCASDIPLSRALNLGIQRTTTLALGGDRCDFRLKRGGETRCAATAFIYENAARAADAE
jgi:hypothetical protein